MKIKIRRSTPNGMFLNVYVNGEHRCEFSADPDDLGLEPGDEVKIGGASDEWTAATTELADLLRRKQADYGPGNIMAFEHVGLMVRLSDKIERLKNLQGRDADPNFESLRDTYMDIAGYAVIGMMLLDGSFPPKEDGDG